MRQRVDLGVFRIVTVDATQTGEGVLAVNVHGARAANALSARPSKGQSGVHLVLNLDKRIENHRPRLVQVDFVALELGLLLRLVWVPSVDFEFLEEDGFLGGRGERAGEGEARWLCSQRVLCESERLHIGRKA